MTTQRKQELASQEIAEILKKINDLYKQVEAIADKSGVSVRYDGPSGYGDGGYYYPRPNDDNKGDWSESDAGWRASSTERC